MRKVNVNQMAAAVMDELQKYNQEVTDKLKEEVKDAAKFCKNEVKRLSPFDTGEYEAGWTAKTLFENASDIRIAVYNSKMPGLTHLLEHGHVVKNQTGKIYGTTMAYPHIAPAEKATEKLLDKKVKVVVKG